MKRRIIIAIAGGFILLIAMARVHAQQATPAMNPNAQGASTLQAQVVQKQQQLQAVQQQLASTTANLKVVQSQKVTLQQQVNVLNGNISSLNLGIQADTLSAQQLELERQALGADLVDISASMDLKESAIGDVLQQMEKDDTANGNLLALFLKKGTLADSVLEANDLLNLQSQLSADITGLKDLQGQYNTNIQQATQKENQINTHETDLQNKKSIVQDQQQQKQTLLATTKNQESIFQSQLTALEKQQQSINNDLEAIDAVLRTKIDPSTLPALGAGVLLMPVQGDTEADITQGYGATAFARTEYVHHWHNGLDLAASIGTPILAAEDGMIAATANEDLYCPRGAYGKFVTINHNDGLTTLYGHLSKVLVTAGQSVKRGQLIAYSGNTGDVTGPHLHFTVFARATYYLDQSKSCGPLPEGGDLDPSGYLF